MSVHLCRDDLCGQSGAKLEMRALFTPILFVIATDKLRVGPKVKGRVSCSQTRGYIYDLEEELLGAVHLGACS